MESLIYPDVKKILITYLSEHLEVPVASRVPKGRPAAFVRILLAGGAGRVDPVFEEVAATVESWDDNEASAQHRAQVVRDLLRRASMMGGHPVYNYQEWGPPVDLPDESGQSRYTFTFSLRLRPQQG